MSEDTTPQKAPAKAATKRATKRGTPAPQPATGAAPLAGAETSGQGTPQDGTVRCALANPDGTQQEAVVTHHSIHDLAD